MASNLISRLLPPRTGSPSVYETLRQHDQSSEASDVEERAGMALDEENLGQHFEDLELDQADVERLSDSHHHHHHHITGESSALLGDNLKQRGNQSWRQQRGTGEALSRPRWMDPSPGSHAAEEGDDEVPQSLLFEGGEGPTATGAVDDHGPAHHADISPVPGPSTPEARVHWETTQRHQTLYRDTPRVDRPRRAGSQVKKGLLLIDPKERAMWRWANVEDLDNFLKDVYDYFLGNGIWCIMLSRALNLLFVTSHVKLRLQHHAHDTSGRSLSLWDLPRSCQCASITGRCLRVKPCLRYYCLSASKGQFSILSLNSRWESVILRHC